MGSFEFTPPYQDGWQNTESGNTPITAEILNDNYDSFLLTLNNWITSVEGLLITIPENITTQVMIALAGLYGELAIENPTSGQVLKFNGSKWVNANESGGGGGGSTVSWQQILQTGTKIGTITIDGMSYDVYAPTPPANTSDLTNDSNFVADASYVHTDNNYTTTEKNKLADLNQVEANPSSGTSAGNLNSIKIGETKYDIPSGGGSSTFAGLTDVDIDNLTLANGQVPVWNSTTEKWENGTGGGGTTVIANPSGTPTDELNSIQIGNDIYEIVGGGSGGSGFSKTTLYEISGTTPESVITLSQSIEDFDLIEVVSLYGHSDEEDYKNTTMFNAEELIDSIGTARPKNWWIGNDTVYVWFYVTDVDEFTIHTQTGQTGLGIWYVYGYKFEGGRGYTEVTGTLTAGQTSITLSDASITTNSTIDVYTDADVEYNSISVSTGSVTITFDAQASNMGVKVRVS